LQQLAPSDAKGQKAYHGRLATQPHDTASLATNASDDDPEDGDGDGDGDGDEGRDNDATGGSEAVVEGGGLGTLAGPSANCSVNVPDGSGKFSGMDSPAEGSGDAGHGSATELQDKDRHVTPPPPSPSIASKCPFSVVETGSDSTTLPPSASQVPSVSSTSHASSSSTSKRGRMTGAIALTHIGNNLADFNSAYRYGVDREHERHQARMEERKARGHECGQAVAQAQELETYLSDDELAALLEVFEEQNSARAYLGIKTNELRKAWVKRKLTTAGITPSFV
jgi:hypothetical protein